MRDDPSSVEPFRLEIDDTTLYYRFGGLKDLIGKIPSTPLDVPLATQFSVEAVRNYRWGPESAKLVSTFLLRTEAIIERELSLIANPRNSEVDLLGAMLQYQRQTDDILLSLPSYFAKRERRWLAPVGSVISFDQCANKYVTSSYYFE